MPRYEWADNSQAPGGRVLWVHLPGREHRMILASIQYVVGLGWEAMYHDLPLELEYMVFPADQRENAEICVVDTIRDVLFRLATVFGVSAP